MSVGNGVHLVHIKGKKKANNVINTVIINTSASRDDLEVKNALYK